MNISRNSFFGLIFCVLILPFPIAKLIWLTGTSRAEGTMYFLGHGNLGSVLGISTYPVIRFKAGRDTIVFNANVNVPLEQGEKVSVRYKRNNPSDAKLNLFSCIWGDTLAYDFAPLLVFAIIFLHPDLIPRKSRVILGKKPFIQVIPL